MVLELALPDMKGMDVLKAVQPAVPPPARAHLQRAGGEHGVSPWMRSPTARRLHHQADHRRGYRFLEQARERLIAKIKELHSRIQRSPRRPCRCASGRLAKGQARQALHRRGGDWRVPRRAQHAGRGDLRDPRGLPGAGADRPAHASRLHELFAERLDALSPLRIREAVSESSCARARCGLRRGLSPGAPHGGRW